MLGRALFGSGEKTQKVSKLRPEQEALFSQLLQALSGEGAGGAYGDVADYYRGLLSGEGAEAFEKPLMRQFQEDIVPGIAEQFAGLGAGGLSGSGFVQETGRASTDLAERLGALRQQLKQQGAAGLSGLTSGAMQPMDELMFRPRESGLFENLLSGIAPGVGKGIGTALGGPIGGALSGAAKSLFGNFLEK